MRYKTLLKKYKEGLLNEEDKALLEQEIEKYEAIEEYLAEDIDEVFKPDIQLASFEKQEQETNKIRKSIRNKLGKVVFTSVAIVVGLYIGIFYGVSGIMDSLYYNPSDITQPKEHDYQYSNFYYDMQAYISLNIPGYTIGPAAFEQAKGFGEYEVSYSLKNHFNDESNRYFVDISRGRLTYAMDGIFSRENRYGVWEGFESIQNHFLDDDSEEVLFHESGIERKNEITRQYLNELNPLSYISMSIVFSEDLTMEEYFQLSSQHTELAFQWLGIRTADPGTKWSESQPMHLIGFNPNLSDEPSSNRRPDFEEYPLFYLFDRQEYADLAEKPYPESITEAYETHFKSRLKYMRDRESFVKIFDYNPYKTDFYHDALEYVDENGVKTYGVLVFGTAQDFLDSIDQIPYESIYINEVLPTKPNIYYD